MMWYYIHLGREISRFVARCQVCRFDKGPSSNPLLPITWITSLIIDTHGAEVKTGEILPFVYSAGVGLRLSQASIGELKEDKANESVCLFATVDEKKLVIATLFTKTLPQQQLGMVFDRDFQLWHEWENGKESESKEAIPHTVANNVVELEGNTIHPEVWKIAIPYVKASEDRAAVSLVCKSWLQIDKDTREHVTVKSAHAAKPERLFRRFPNLRLLKIKGMSTEMLCSIPMGSGDMVTPWFTEIVKQDKIEVLDIRRMIVTDGDVDLLVNSKMGKALKVLKLQYCRGFSTHGLLNISRECRVLRNLSLERSNIIEHGREWLHELALNSSTLESLNFYRTGLGLAIHRDLELIAINCESLVSLKITHCVLEDLNNFFEAANVLQEFGGACTRDITIEQFEAIVSEGFESIDELTDLNVRFPHSLSHLSLISFGSARFSFLLLIGCGFKKLDLQSTLFDTKDHFYLLAKCPNLEILKTTEVLGDDGLEVVAATCKKLKKLRIYEREQDQDDSGVITEWGLIALSEGCVELEYLTIYMSSVTNEALKCVGRSMKKLCDFRLMLFVVNSQQKIRERILDTGVQSLLKGCRHLTRLSLLFYTYWLTVSGIKSIGKYGKNVKVMQLGNIVRSDEMMLKFFEHGSRSHSYLRNPTRLQKLEVLDMWNCCFLGIALAEAVRKLNSLRFLWIQGEVSGNVLPNMVRETIQHHGRSNEIHHIAYRTLDGEMPRDLPGVN
ncbi:Coronatine-insensitive protein 1 [Abeliophyllum distichum]|uniref:Coronatine-insensitive protein 1 n=1 Tax=Abeliophyllum distichum TaxID=126358 RepID=A0ABD1UIT8_9LAMI